MYMILKTNNMRERHKWKVTRNYYAYIRQNVMDQKSKDKPQPTTARVQMDNPIPISLNGLTLQYRVLKDNEEVYFNKMMPLYSEN